MTVDRKLGAKGLDMRPEGKGFFRNGFGEAGREGSFENILGVRGLLSRGLMAELSIYRLELSFPNMSMPHGVHPEGSARANVGREILSPASRPVLKEQRTVHEAGSLSGSISRPGGVAAANPWTGRCERPPRLPLCGQALSRRATEGARSRSASARIHPHASHRPDTLSTAQFGIRSTSYPHAGPISALYHPNLLGS